MTNSWILLTSIVLVLAVVLELVWQYRISAAKRWLAVLDDYAEREIARTGRRHAPGKAQAESGRGQVLQP